MTTAEQTAPYSGRTAWARNLQTPLREFVETETGGAAVLLVAAAAALVWVNVDAHSYDSFWSTTLSIDVGDSGIALDLREWVNSGLMTFFFFVVGLEARREFDLGELRERRRFVLPLLAALGGMAVPVAIYLALQRRPVDGARLGGRDVDRHGVRARAARARRAALPGPPARLHADDRRRRRHRRRSLVIAVVYSEDIAPPALLVADRDLLGASWSLAPPGFATGSCAYSRSAPPSGSPSSSRASTRSSSAS